MNQHASIALNALLEGNKEAVAKQHISHLTSQQKLELLDTLPFPQQQSLLFATIDQLASHISFGETVASLFGQSLARYIYTHIGTVIPYVLQLPIIIDTVTTKTLPTTLDPAVLMDAIAATLFMSTRTLYKDYGYLGIVHCLLLDSTSVTMDQRHALLDSVFSTARPHLSAVSNDDHVPQRLLDGHITRVTSILSVELWHRDHQFVLDGLEMIKEWSGYENKSLVYYLRTYMLSILSHANQVVSQQSFKTHHALTSLIVLLDTIGDEASSFIPQLLGIAQTSMDHTSNMEQEDYAEACCLLWNRLLLLSGLDQSAQHFGDVVRGMVSSFPLCPPLLKSKFADELTSAIKSRALGSTMLDHLPDIPPYPELASLSQWIDEERDTMDEISHMSVTHDDNDHEDRNEMELKQLIIHMSMNEVMPSFHSLQKLHRFLSKHQDLLFTSGTTTDGWSLLGELYDVLLRIIKQNAYRFDISGLAASCLGMLGAVDPSRLLSFEERQDIMVKIKNQNTDVTENEDEDNDDANNPNKSMRYTNDMIVLENYADRSENQTFAIHLIVHYFLPTFYTSNTVSNTSSSAPMPATPSMSTSSYNDTSSSSSNSNTGSGLIQSCSQYAIQEILKAVGFSHDRVKGDAPATAMMAPPGRRRPLRSAAVDDDIRATRRLWYSLDPIIQDLMEPLLYSKFEANVELTTRSPPLFELASNSFDEWTCHLCFLLMEKVNATATSDHSRQMLHIFQACIPSVKTGHVVLTQHLIPFLVLRLLLSSPTPTIDRKLILDEIIGVLTHGSSNSDMKQSTLQLIVSITAHCRKWIRLKLQQKKRTARSTSTHEDPAVTSIKNFLAKIPHHLMAQAAFRTGNYPQALMHFELAIKDEEKVKGRSKRNGGPEAMAEVLSKSNRMWSRPLEILRFESRGEWQHAKLGYEDLLPGDSLLTGRYFHCLQQLGDYDRIINYAGFLLDQEDISEALLKQVNRYRAEAAWKSSNWPLLHECIHLPMDDSFDASLAYVLAHMQKKQPLAVYLEINHATVALINHISQSNTESYQQSYDTVLRLQLLHELESVMMIQSDAAASSSSPSPNNATSVDEDDPFLVWKTKFSMLKPSYSAQRQLLDLRLAAQFDIWKNNDIADLSMTDNERELRLLLAKTARKAKDMGMALQATYAAHPSTEPLALIELAKWYYARSEAQFLQARIMGSQLIARRSQIHPSDKVSWTRYATEIKRVENAYVEIRKKSADWEKVYCVSGAWEEQRCDSLEMDHKYFKRAARAVRFYCDALKIGCRYYYSTMPRLLSLWLQIVDSMRDLSDGKLRLVSRLAIQDDHVAHILAKIILNVLITYPRTTIWALQFAVHSQDMQLKSISGEILRQAQILKSDPLLTRIISQTHQFTRQLELLSKEKCSGQSWVKLGSGHLLKHTGLLHMTNLDLCIPQESTQIPRLPESLGRTAAQHHHHQHHQHHPYPTDMPTIAGVLPAIQVMNSLQRPKRISFRGSDGKTYDFLCKQNDDLRKDARMMEFSHMINQFLMKNATSRQQRLYIRTYAVIPLSNRWGLIEWINHLNPLKAIVRERWEADGIGNQYERLRYAMKQMEGKTVEEKVETLLREVYPASPVVFYRWFLDHFPEPSEWYASRSRYIRTLAVMSIVGYVLGLGDRHADNVMFDATNGDTVHVDVNLLFDYGQDLAVPEIVPFRLTRNLIDAMGTPKEAGLFKRSCITTLSMLRDYRTQLISVFETFLHDPITDRRKRDSGMTREQVARKEIDIMSTKIQSRPSVQSQVEYLIKEASSDRNLAQMYSGWTAFI
ncbi:hypothetical protein BCR42DRAFT_428472 [Absidia repens]|uniref:Serine/threonine-protein kinase ATR n=1 Tax=Absidia repens TaxID=90262 RepID=A0A1X2HYB3_9FUNG|nr:hypothetical protein BCR42DRAFT_428472 [Absidia repens]